MNLGTVIRFNSSKDRDAFNLYLMEEQQRGKLKVMDTFASHDKLFIVKKKDIDNWTMPSKEGEM